MRRNLYDLLGVRPDDDSENLRKAFLRAAKESHPDHHGDDPEAVARFMQIVEAYDILRDAGQRAAYDRLLEAEHRPLRAKLKAAPSHVKRHIISDTAIGVILAVVLASGYALYSRTPETAVDEGAGVKAHDAAQLNAVQPAPQSGAAERGRPSGGSAPQMPIALPIENPVASPIASGDTAPAGRTIEVARMAVARTDTSRGDSGLHIPVDRVEAKVDPDDSAKNRTDELQSRHDARSVDVQVPVAEAHTVAPGPSSSGAAAPANKPDSQATEPVTTGAGIAKQPAETAESRVYARLHAVVKRPLASRAPFRHASLARRHVWVRRMHAPYCEGDTPPPSVNGY
jgi:curved DNA-binding protein CbpA